MDQFQTYPQENVSNESLGVRPGNTLCFVGDYHTLDYVRKALQLTDTDRTDLIVMTVQVLKGPEHQILFRIIEPDGNTQDFLI